MPFKSLAQEGYMHEHPEVLGKSGLKEWDAATKGKHLPKHVKGGSMKQPKHGFHKTEVTHHHDGSHTVMHHHVDPEKSVEHAVPDLAGVQGSLEQHIGQAATPEPSQPSPPMMGASA